MSIEVGAGTVQEGSAAEAFGYAESATDSEVKEESKVEEKSEDTLSPQELINQTMKSLELDDKGKFIYPDDIDPILKAAIGATKSFRDTQSSYTKAQQELKGTQAEIEALRQTVISTDPLIGLSDTEKSELAELKYTNPDKWYQAMRNLEAQSAKQVEEKFEGVRKEASEKTIQQQRTDALEEYNATAENKLTQEQLTYDIPPRWAKDVEEGKLSFEDFLKRSADLLYGKKTVANPTVDNPTDLTQVAGGTKDPNLPNEGIDYANVTF